ncbi:MAG: flagellar hook-basal body complex protein FliE [Candidatus Melainabacteria bacterium]|nr:flagellar hook-basal body complex protein FliE [Candidatus Melainabacteria bacterium]
MKESPMQFKNLMPTLPSIPQIPVLKGQVNLGGGGTFGNVLSEMLGKVNKMMNKSEQLTEAAVTTGKVNLHEVMIAMAEEEIALGLTTQVAGKFISTVEKLTQMQV